MNKTEIVSLIPQELHMSHPEYQYLYLLQTVLEKGHKKSDRTGVGTLSIFGYQMRFPLQNQFPLITTKKIHFKSVVYELLWFLRGESNIQFLKENQVRIWDPWADENGELGPIYGVQWRKWKSYDGKNIDQIQQLIETLKTNPNSRRLLVSAWNVAELPQMALPPCHVLFQCYVHDSYLSLQLYQRSADLFIGLPFNIASYALLCYMIAHVTNLKPYELIISIGDAHLYLNHIEQAKTQLQRKPFPFPQVTLNPAVQSIDDFKYQDIQILNYQAHPHIKAPVAV